MGKLVLMGTASVLEDGQTLKTEGGDGCPALRANLTLLNCMLIRDYGVSIVYFTTIKNKNKSTETYMCTHMHTHGILLERLCCFIGEREWVLSSISNFKLALKKSFQNNQITNPRSTPQNRGSPDFFTDTQVLSCSQMPVTYPLSE